jgi:hypothetical protein
MAPKKAPPPVVEDSGDTIYETKRTGPYRQYSDELAVEICSRIACGEALVRICRDEDMPAVTTVYYWIREREDFREMYKLAREDMADTLADELLSITEDEEDVARARLKCDVRKWISSKLRPIKYGERLDIQANNNTTITAIRRIIVDTDGTESELIGGREVPLLPEVGKS